VRKSAIAVMLVVLGGAVVVCGCASTPQGPSDEELIAEVVEGMKGALVAQDLDTLMTFYSENFEHWEYGDKAGLKNFMEEAIDMGYLENAEVSTDKAETTIEKDTAKVYPVEFAASFGSATIGVELKKEGMAWLITSMDIEIY